jgi:Tol biopolymer transport system component
MVFEYNQQIWEMNLDGSDLHELVSAGRELRFPTYSPDADTIVYLGRSAQEFYDIALHFTELDTGERSTVDLAGVLSPTTDPTIVPNGPLSWSE